MPNTPPETLIWERFRIGDGCWHWTGATHRGYGQVGRGGRRAHRVVYEVLIGPIPPGMVLDHTCHNDDPECRGGPTCRHRSCVNPWHMTVTTLGQNVLSGKTLAAANRDKTCCPYGHEYTYSEQYRQRVCWTCRREADRRRYRENKLNERKTLCPG